MNKDDALHFNRFLRNLKENDSLHMVVLSINHFAEAISGVKGIDGRLECSVTINNIEIAGYYNPSL